MGSISAEDRERLIDRALAGDSVAGRELFSEVIEPLADLFEPDLCDAYVRLFAPVIARALPDLNAAELIARYERVRHARPVSQPSPGRVFVLSRITLGSDIAVTSVILDAAMKRWPDAEIVFVGPAKNYELFAASPSIRHVLVAYPRSGGLAERLAAHDPLAQAITHPNSIVIDPDSRLTQLGLLPVCPEDRYYFFESRSYGGESGESLVSLTRRWAADIIGVTSARAFIAVNDDGGPAPDVAVSLGVGDNPAKRVPDPFEADLLCLLTTRFENVLVDSGGGGEESERVRNAVMAAGNRARIWTGSFARFAARIARSRLYVGYDSAGGHVAAACGTPAFSIFEGFPSERMLERWRPDGPGPAWLIRAEAGRPEAALEQVREALSSYTEVPDK